MKIKWLGRCISAPAPYLCLCLSEQEYRAALKRLNVESSESWISKDANATTHVMYEVVGLATIVCLNVVKEMTSVQIAGLLVHEAVHIWQEWCVHYNEKDPAVEQEAYAIQAISQELMAEYARRLKEKNHGS